MIEGEGQELQQMSCYTDGDLDETGGGIGWGSRRSIEQAWRAYMNTVGVDDIEYPGFSEDNFKYAIGYNRPHVERMLEMIVEGVLDQDLGYRPNKDDMDHILRGT